MKRSNGVIGAFRAAPATILAHWGMLSSPAICEPRSDFKNVVQNSVVRGKFDPCVSKDQKQVTSAGQGNSIMIALMIVEILLGEEKADEIGGAMGIPVEEGEDETVSTDNADNNFSNLKNVKKSKSKT